MNFPEVKYEARIMHLQAALSPMAVPTLLGTELDPGLPLDDWSTRGNRGRRGRGMSPPGVSGKLLDPGSGCPERWRTGQISRRQALTQLRTFSCRDPGSSSTSCVTHTAPLMAASLASSIFPFSSPSQNSIVRADTLIRTIRGVSAPCGNHLSSPLDQWASNSALSLIRLA